MQVFLFINGDNQYRIIRIQNSLRDLQPLLHHREPLAMTIAVGSVDIVVVVLPVAGSRVVGRVYVNADFDTIEKALSSRKGLKKA